MRVEPFRVAPSPYYVPSWKSKNFAMDWAKVCRGRLGSNPVAVRLLTRKPHGCSGATLSEWKTLFDLLSEKYGFVIASDECYR
jgi:hypothetical protein